ncbi:MAG TPA: hypothetical protein VHN80_24260 [Kineosporiaceae bacterium]|nr:hypothetical protein [Kineosporiaceae bacterium]
MSIASQPDERSDVLEVYLGQGGGRALSLAISAGGPAAGSAVERVTSAVLRGGLTSWVHVGMMVRRLRGRADPLQGLGRRETFQALCRLVEAAIEARPLGDQADGPDPRAHVRMLSTPMPAPSALAAIEQVLKPYAAAGSVTRSGRAVIGWFAIRHLIATRSSAFSLQIVHLSPIEPGAFQVSLMLPRTADDDRAVVPVQAAPPVVAQLYPIRSTSATPPTTPGSATTAASSTATSGAPAMPMPPVAVASVATGALVASSSMTSAVASEGSASPSRHSTSAAAAAVRSMLSARGRRAHRAVVPTGPGGMLDQASMAPAGSAASGSSATSGGAADPRGSGGAVPSAEARGRHPLQGYLDAYREHLTRELLLEPLVASGSASEFAWAPESTGDGGVAVGGTVPGSLSDQVVLRMAEHAVAQLGERSPQSAGAPLSGPEPDGDLLVQRWSVGPSGGFVLTVAAKTGQRRRPTQVLIHFAAAAGQRVGSLPDPTPGPPGGAPALLAPYEVPRTGSAVDEARGLLILPLWWHSAEARCDGNDVILYEMPFRGKRLRVRANDYPAEPMYTLLVGDPGAEVAAVDIENWPSPWVRPRTF